MGVLMIVIGLSVTKEAWNGIGGVLVLVSAAMCRVYWMRFRRSVGINEGVDKPSAPGSRFVCEHPLSSDMILSPIGVSRMRLVRGPLGVAA